MPYLQLDVPNHYPVDVKRRLAQRFGDIFARIMQTRLRYRSLSRAG